MTAPWMRHLGHSFNRNSPSILSGVAVGGVIATAFLTARATVNATRIIDVDRQAGAENSRKEEFELVWMEYIPPVLAAAATVCCIVGANQIGLRRNAALVGAYTLADTAFREYKDEVLTQFGKAKEQKVNDQIAARKIDEHPVSNAEVFITGVGEQLCFETLTGRYFKSDIEKIRQAVNELNAGIIHEMYASLNELFDRLGLAQTTVGDELGWNLDNLCELRFTTHLADNGVPCLAISYTHMPRADYGKF